MFPKWMTKDCPSLHCMVQSRVEEAEKGQGSDGLTAGDDCREKGLNIVQSQEATEDRHMKRAH